MRAFGCRHEWWLCLWLCSYASLAAAQPAQEPLPAAPADDAERPEQGAAQPDAGAGNEPSVEPEPEPPPFDSTDPAAPSAAPPRGDTPVTPETFVNPTVAPPVEAAPTGPSPSEPADAGPPATPAPPQPPAAAPGAPPAPSAPTASTAPLVVWATAGWAGALGSARCGAKGLEGSELAIRLASTLQRSAAAAGIGVAAAGALGDHPLIAYAAKQQPALLAELLAEAGFSALAVGIADMSGPLLREPQLAHELERRGIAVIASNLECGGQSWCEAWLTADDPLPILEREGRRYALIAVLPDDLLARVEPAAGRRFQLRSAAATLLERTKQARAKGADLIVASIDHGPDATASSNLANFLAELPPDVRPDLLLSPSSSDNLLFLRPLDVHPAVVGTRSGVLTGLRVTKLRDTNDSDVFARSVRLNDWNASFAGRLRQLGVEYCQARGTALPGGKLATPLTAADLVILAADAARELSGADLALVDPLAYDTNFAQPRAAPLQRGQMERAVALDSPLVVASVTLDWLGNLNKSLNGLRPLTLIGTGTDRGDPVIAGRIPVLGALYRIVTSAVLARSGRLPDAAWAPLDAPHASLRSALLAHLDVAAMDDPRNRVRDPLQSTQWVLRTDGQLQANLTAVKNPSEYDEPALHVNDSRQLGARLVLNLDADSPKFLFENALQAGFDRNFATRTTAQDLVFLQTTYTYRGLWPRPLLYPHPFVEGYVETQFDRGNAPYHHLLLRPEAGLRSMVSRVLSLKVSAGFQYEALDPNGKLYPGFGAELVLKPSTIPLSNGTLQLEGNVTYYWNSPGDRDQQTLRAQLISAIQLIGPLQFTLTALGAVRKDRGGELGKGLGIQAGIRLRFVDRTLSE